MKKRSPIAVFLLGLVTIGIYSWYWAVKTKGEMNKLGEHVPTAWIWLIPLVGGIWWYWKYSEAVEHVTQKELSAVVTFLLLFLLGSIGQAICQDYFNKVNDAPAAAGAGQPAPAAPVAASLAPAAPQSPTTPPNNTPPKPPTVVG